MDDRRNKIIVGGLITLIVLAIVILAFLKSGPKCELIDTKPEKLTDISKIKNITSDDYKSLVHFDGYLKYFIDLKDEKKKEFMPLNIQSIITENIKDSTDKTLTLNADCAKLVFLVKDSKIGQNVLKIDVELTTPNGDSKNCVIELVKDNKIDAETGKHYSCTIEKTYACNAKKDNKEYKVADLILNYLEFEIDGNSDKIKLGQFSTPEAPCNATSGGGSSPPLN